jgi:hypothetical protein
MIHATSSKLHWNYFIALERDLEIGSRYVECCEPNFSVYSIEFAHLLFAAASEVDVVAKLLCQRLQPSAHRGKINEYCAVLLDEFADLTTTQVLVPRYGLTLTPWADWTIGNSPIWWRSYNDVKHERDAHFDEATLKNALNALGALLILTHHRYSYALAPKGVSRLSAMGTRQNLLSASTLFHFADEYYRDVNLAG